MLIEAQVEFVIVGGLAAAANGLRKRIKDLDVVYRRSPENFRRLAAALAPFRPRPRGSARNFEASWNATVLRDGYSFIMATTLGDLDLFAELSSVGTWQKARRRSVLLPVLGFECDCLTIDALIENLIASGREKDLRMAARLDRFQRSRSARIDP